MIINYHYEINTNIAKQITQEEMAKHIKRHFKEDELMTNNVSKHKFDQLQMQMIMTTKS